MLILMAQQLLRFRFTVTTHFVVIGYQAKEVLMSYLIAHSSPHGY